MYGKPNLYDTFSVTQSSAPPSLFSTDLEEKQSTLPISTTITTGVKSKHRVPWSTGLFDCLSDRRNCCKTCWCPCVTFGQIAEIVDKGSSSCGVNGGLYTVITCVTCCCCCFSCFYRAKMRQQHSLKEGPCKDCMVHFCCEYCALCQEYRELQAQGYDLSIGWQGNMEKKNRKLELTEVAPIVENGMYRES